MNASLKSRRYSSEFHHAQRSERARFKVYRHDGVLLGGASSRERAEAMAACIRQGQGRDFATVVTREAKS